ncbi:hypothetical protein Tco_0481360 [Tanacetum coccineum]
MLNHSKAEPMELLRDVLCQVGVTTIIAKFLILDMTIDRDTPILVGRGFLHTCGGILNTIERITSTFDGICHQTFRAAQTSLDTSESDRDDKEEYAIKRNKFGALIYGPKLTRYLNCSDPLDRSLALQEVMNPFRKICVWKKTMGGNDEEAGSSRPKRSKHYKTMEERHIYSSCVVNCEILNRMGCGEEINGMLRINFASFATSFIQPMNLMRLGLYHSDELDDEGFDVYFQGSLRSDEHFYAQEYWLSISLEENLSLSRSHVKNDLWLLSMFDARHQNGYANVAWLIARWVKRKGAGTQRESMICCGQFITKIDRKARVLSDEGVDRLLLGRLILEDPQSGVPRVVIPRPPRTSMQDLYERMSSMEIRQGAIEGCLTTKYINWDRYDGLLDYLSTWLGFTVFHCR